MHLIRWKACEEQILACLHILEMTNIVQKRIMLRPQYFHNSFTIKLRYKLITSFYLASPLTLLFFPTLSLKFVVKILYL